jgi:hypothetical protein
LGAAELHDPAMTKTRTVDSLQTAVVLTKLDALLRLFAVMCTFMLWYSLAFAAAALYLAWPGRLEWAYQVLTTAGLAPIPLIVASWRGVESLLVRWSNAYVRKHVQQT